MLGAGLEMQRFETRAPLARELLRAASLEVSGKNRPTEEDSGTVPASGFVERLLQDHVDRLAEIFKEKPAGLMRSFESDLAFRSGHRPGPLVNGEAIRAYWRGNFYTALHDLGSHYVDGLASGPAAVGFARHLEDAPPAGPGARFRLWYSAIAEILNGRSAEMPDFDLLSNLGELGGTAALRLFSDLDPFLQKDGARIHEGLRRLAERLDGRPSHRVEFLQLALRRLWDIPLFERHCSSYLALSAHDGVISAWCSLFLGKERDAFALAGREDLTLDERVTALWYLWRHSRGSDAALRSRYRALLRESDYDRTVVAGYIGYLEDHVKDYAEYEQVARAWLQRHGPEEGLVHAIYQGNVAHALDLQGKHAAAWAVIEPWIQTWQGAIMDWGAEILQHLGRAEEARKLAEAAVERYPDGVEVRARLAEVLWSQNRFSEAALVIRQMAYSGWRGAGKAFARAFRGKPDEAAVTGFEAIVAERADAWHLHSFIDEVARERPALGFELYKRVRGVGRVVAESRLLAYRCLRESAGREKAIDWLRTNFPKGLHGWASELAIAWGDHELLWDIAEPPAEPDRASFLWNLRAAAARLAPAGSATRRQELLAHFADARPGDLSYRIGRYLVGLESAPPEIPAGASRSLKTEAACLLALERMAERDLEESSDWFHATWLLADGEQPVDGLAMGIAIKVLADWYSEGKPLKRIAERSRS